MTKKFRSILAMLLAIVMLALPAAGVIATATPTEFEINETLVTSAPRVDCRGAFHTLYDENNNIAFDFENGGAVLGSVTDLLDDIVKDAAKLDWMSISKRLSDLIWDFMGDSRFDKNGEPVVKMFGKESENQRMLDEKRMKSTYDFDWRDDPIRQASLLHDYIQKVKEAHGGIEKVILTVQSGSGPLMGAYLDQFGTDELCGAFLRASMHNGSSIFGDIVNKRLNFNDSSLADANFWDEFKISQDIQDTLIPLFKLLYESGILRVICSLGNVVLKQFIDQLYKDAIIPVLLSQPVYWAYVPAEDYESGIKTIFGKDARTGEWAGLVKKLDDYHAVALRLNDLLLDANKKMRVAIISNYGAPLFPVVENSYISGDNLVDCVYSSCGATIAPLRETLKGPFFGLFPYKQKVSCNGHNHISPDNQIDASTCLLPDTTWFFSGGMHFSINDNGLVEWFFRSEQAPTVFSDEKFPQFLMKGEDNGAIPLVVEKKEFNLTSYVFLKLLNQIRFFVNIYTWWLP